MAGLIQKYIVERVDGRDSDGEKHEGCQYFVLDLDHDPHAWAGLIGYAAECHEIEVELASDLLKLASESRRKTNDAHA